MKMTLKTLAEDENREVLVTESKMIIILFEKKEKKAKVVYDHNVVHVFEEVNNKEEIEKMFNESIFDITVKTGACMAYRMNNYKKE